MNLTNATPDRVDQVVGATRIISVRELTERSQPPSRTLLEHEASLIAELARLTHLDGREFVEWPKFEVAPDDYRYGASEHLYVKASVIARSTGRLS